MRLFSSAKYTRVLRLTVLSTALALVGCQSVNTTAGGAVGVERKQRMALSAEAVNQASAQEYSELLAMADKKKVLNADPALANRVRSISARLISHVTAFRPDAKDWAWQVNVLQDDKELNAFCMAGGKIAVFSGLVNQLKLSDAELAAVIGHEIAHALREHVREQLSEQQGIELLSVLAGAVTKNDQIGKIAGQGLQIYGLKHSRRAEIEADLMGVELAARAGYDPRAAVGLWDKMAAANPSRPPEFLSTHPDPENRQAALMQAAQRVWPLYQSATKNNAPFAPLATSASAGSNTTAAATNTSQTSKSNFTARRKRR